MLVPMHVGGTNGDGWRALQSFHSGPPMRCTGNLLRRSFVLFSFFITASFISNVPVNGGGLTRIMQQRDDSARYEVKNAMVMHYTVSYQGSSANVYVPLRLSLL